MLLGIKIRTFIELQNLTITWFPQRETACNYKDCSRSGKDFGSELLLDQHIDQVHGGVHQKKSSNSFLSKMMGITPADEHYKKIMRQPIYKAERRKPYSRWNAALRYYDLCDVLVPAVFLLKIGMDVVSRERATCTTTNVVPYLRQVLMVYKNEPSLTVFRKEMPPGKYFPIQGVDRLRLPGHQELWGGSLPMASGPWVNVQRWWIDHHQKSEEFVLGAYCGRLPDCLFLGRHPWTLPSPSRIHRSLGHGQTSLAIEANVWSSSLARRVRKICKEEVRFDPPRGWTEEGSRRIRETPLCRTQESWRDHSTRGQKSSCYGDPPGDFSGLLWSLFQVWSCRPYFRELQEKLATTIGRGVLVWSLQSVKEGSHAREN